MARKPVDSPKKRTTAYSGDEVRESVLPDDRHPDYLDGAADDPAGAFTEGEASGAAAGAAADPLLPRPFPPLRACSPVSGRYTLRRLPVPLPGPGPRPPAPILPPIRMTVRVDVDRFLPQQRISIEVVRNFPRAQSHAIAEVTSDRCLGINRRRVEAAITYRDGDASLILGDRVTFEAQPTAGKGYGAFRLTLTTAAGATRVYPLSLQSTAFDDVHFEVDRVDNAGTPVVSYDSASHPTRPADLPAETLSLATVFRRAGFNVTLSPHASVIPVADAGGNGTWSDSEMHNAMVTYWSRFQDLPQWALWVLFAARHDMGPNLGGIMFDDIGPNHRQGTAIFRNSFIQNAPAGDPNPAAWSARMEFWCAVHEMGHAFNLAHSWQKSLGDPWIPLANENEARSFMNYPYNVVGGQASFFSDFRYAFSPSELQFMRHAPRRFVQMGASDWFVDHNFEGPRNRVQQEGWTLAIRPNRASNQYAFMEPVKLELKLTNASSTPRHVEPDLLGDGGHVSLVVARNGAGAKQWHPFVTRCLEPRERIVKPAESVYGEHLVSADTSGWLIDEPGFYDIQAAVDVEGEIVLSNVLRLQVMAPAKAEEDKLAMDYFTEGVGRVLAFDGAPHLEQATQVLREVHDRLPSNPAAIHAAIALSTPGFRRYKLLQGAERGLLSIASAPAAVSQAVKAQNEALVKSPDAAADTLGHIDYFAALDRLAAVIAKEGNENGARGVLKKSVETMKRRKVLPSVVAATERKLAGSAKALESEAATA